MKRSSENTKKRILKAALKEFSAYGLAGARVDRIAESAKCNKQAIYAYYGSKELLHRAVYELIVEDVISHVDLDPTDIPGFVVQLAKKYRKDADILRFFRWTRLETENEAHPYEAMIDFNIRRLALIEEAQKKGYVTKKISAVNILLFIISAAIFDVLATPRSFGLKKFTGDRDETLREAINRLIKP